MIRKSENPLRPGNIVWRGWSSLLLVGVIAEVGEPHENEGDLLVPVRYRNWEYGIVVVHERMKMDGRMAFSCREVPIKGAAANISMRFASGMPDVISASPDMYLFGVNEAGVDLMLEVPRRKGTQHVGKAMILAMP